ncbi:BREX-2 system adenine-specific DNA-methyltransferase PglX [Streptomyces griseoincarnatus]
MDSVIDRKRLREDLQKQLVDVERDLQDQLGRFPQVAERLRAEYKSAFKAKRTGASVTEWLGERVTQAAVAWLLGTVFVRFCEDNLLLAEPFISAPSMERQTHAQERHSSFIAESAAHTHRDWLITSFSGIASSQAGGLLFDESTNPLYQIPLSHEGAKRVIDFWRLHEESSDGAMRIIHNFEDPDWDTRFLGDLYQFLSVDARRRYALFQTPEFVEEFILDRSLTPATREFGYESIKIIDPACGSGHFVLGAFHRVLGEWERNAPSVDLHDRVRRAMESVHGVDVNPFAVAIARFRLLIAGLKAAGLERLSEAANYEWPINIATGDSLLKRRQEKIFDIHSGGDESESFVFSTEDESAYLDILTPGRYHVVVGNPPYIQVKDKELNLSYREMYKYCSGLYQLTVPFVERFFELAKRGDEYGVGAGWVGQIVSNGFMKREFGEKIVENYLASEVDLTEVIDTSGAYIPHHGTPTVIMVGRRRPAKLGATTVRTVRSVQGEPGTPKDPTRGVVWRAIVDQIDKPRSRSEWVSVGDLSRDRYFGKHPWILADGGLEAVQEIEATEGKKLKQRSYRVGTFGKTNADEAMVAETAAWRRRNCSDGLVASLYLGDQVRDWGLTGGISGFFPYNESRELSSLHAGSAVYKWLWPTRTTLGNRATFSKRSYFKDGRKWYEWSQVPQDLEAHDWVISLSFVATHNHASVERDGGAFKNSALVVKLHRGAKSGDHFEIAGILNSSAACFWLKQMCHCKGSTVDSQGARQNTIPFEDFYEFNGKNVSELPLPYAYPVARATELDTLARQLAAVTPSAAAADPEKPPTPESLTQAKIEWHRIRARMIAVQEELDWEVYGIYGLHDDLTASEDALPADGIALGQRAFEIDLGKRVKEKGVKTEWFRRHNSTMISEIPAEWPEAYKETVRRRLEAMKNSSVIGLIERPEYKRRWLTDSWEDQQQAALKEWLLARMERRELWYETDYDGTERPRTRSLPELVDDLTRDHDFVAVAELYAPGEELSVIVPKLVEDQHVPFLAALRYTEAAHKKKREVWEQVWERQREEDAATAAGDHRKAMEIRDGTPVPPKYTTADFRKASYAAQRGGLDVPKERFISYSRTLNPAIEVLGWGGWDHLEQATALTETINARADSGNWEREDFLPYLAGLLELLPWLRQWHPEDAGMFGEALLDWQREEEFAVTDEELRAWRPARKAAKKATAKPAGGKSAKRNTQAKE